MVSRRDQLDSHRFTRQRAVAALVGRESSPFRRPAAAALVGALLATVSLAAVAVYGAIRPDGDAWREPGALIVERETGTRYVLLDGTLHPVLNHASALLIVGAERLRPVTVPRRALDGVPRGAALGIPGAPDPLPARDRLVTGSWTVCAAAGRSTVHIGQSPAGRALGADEALLVRPPTGQLALLWRGRAHRVTDFAIGALAWRGEAPVPVGPGVVDALPVGAELGPVAIPGRGARSRAAFAVVGQVFVVRPQGGPPRYAVALADGLSPISEVRANLLLSDARTAAVQGRAGAIELSQASYAAAPVAAPLEPTGDLARLPTLARPSTVDGSVCTAPGGVWLDAPPAPVLPAGYGALVGSPPFLVTDQGVRYPVPDPAALGYTAVDPMALPAAVLDAVPLGPALDPAAARLSTGPR